MVFSNFQEVAFGLASLGTGILSFLLALAVFLGNPKSKVNSLWALASLTVAVWGFGLGMAILSSTKTISIMWNYVFYTGGVWIPTSFLWFVSVFTRKTEKPAILISCTIMSIFLMLIVWFRFDWFIQDIGVRGPFRYWNIIGPAYNLFAVFFFFVMGYACFRLFQSINSDSKIEKGKRWVAIGISTGVIGSTTDFFYFYNIDIYPFGQFLVFLYPLLISWAVVKYQAMDIRALMKKTGIFIIIYLFLIALIIPVPIYVHGKINEALGPLAYLVIFEIFIIAGVLSLGPYIYALIIKKGVAFHEHTLAGLTHELKSPLAAIESALDMLSHQKEKIEANKNDTPYVEMIERNSLRLRSFIEDLLHVFGDTKKDRVLNIKNTSLSDLVQKLCESLRPLAQNKGVELRWQSEGSLFGQCDSKRIEQVLSNLLSNAIKFTREGYVEVRLKSLPKEIQFEVEDSGDRFFQGKGTNQSRGTGIGLYIAKIWVEEHGGEIHVESKGEGKGSRFWFTLPKT